MIEKREFKFKSADGKTMIHVIMWIPEGEKIGVIQIAHGVTEFAGRYEDTAKFFAEKGFVVVCNDHLGHGLSIDKPENKMYFGDWEHLVSDVTILFDMVRKEYFGIPYFVMGFSMGSFVMREFLLEHSKDVTGAIIMGTGYQPKFITKLMRMLVNNEAKKIGENNTSDFIKQLSDKVYNDKTENPICDRSWLLKNEEALMEYMNNPMCGGPMSAGLFREMLYGMEVTCDKNNVKQMNSDLPVLLMSGTEDPVGDMTKGVYSVQKLFKKAGMKDVELLLYPDSRHDILHEQVRDKVLYDWAEWMESKIRA